LLTLMRRLRGVFMRICSGTASEEGMRLDMDVV
jgi:hypothetical protein